MNELLQKAMQLIEAREKAAPGEWQQCGRWIDLAATHERIGHYEGERYEDMRFVLLAANHTADVIKGYQELLRRVVDAHYDSFPSGLSAILISDIETSLPEISHE
jgi:hypothetical protein